MKKIMKWSISLVLAIMLFTACSGKENDVRLNDESENEIGENIVEDTKNTNVSKEENEPPGEDEGLEESGETNEENHNAQDSNFVLENEAFKIISPAPHAEVENKIVVRGLARVFEAAFQYELEDGHYVYEHGFATASSGAPEWGEFEFTLDVSEVQSENVTLYIYVGSPKDGSRQHELAIPLKINNGEKEQDVAVENDAFKIFSPEPNSIVHDRIEVRGMARVFEATVQYELEDGHDILEKGFTTASVGAHEWGEFEILIDFAEEEVPNDHLLLILYEESAKDGSRVNELVIPLKVKK